MMRIGLFVLALAIAAAPFAIAPAAAQTGGSGSDGGYDGDDRYRWRGGLPDWDVTRSYRDDPSYSERRLSADEWVFQGSDGRFYCRRNDGTTGLVIGAGVGALVVGLTRGRDRGGVRGGMVGALISRDEVERGLDLRCR